MDSVLVIIRMTGLLLLAPSGNGDGLPLQVLMPVPRSPVPEHVAQIGYRKDKDEDCDYWQDDICYVNLKGWSVEIGQSAVSGPLPLPAGNVTRVMDRPVGARELSQNPFSALRARVTLHSGRIESMCALGQFEFDGHTDSLANVVTWEMKVPNTSLDLRRTTLNYGPIPPRTQHIAVLEPIRDTIEVFIRHVPRSEQNHQFKSHSLHVGDHATHFRAFYSLLNPSSLTGPTPEFKGYTNTNSCYWVTRLGGGRVEFERRNVGTMSCMVASGGFMGP